MALRPLRHTLLPPRRWPALSSLLWYDSRQAMNGQISDSRFQGPRGLDKILISADGDITVTNDGATILGQVRP